jgi:nucleotide-binding universal stress UspA family protein
MAVVNHILVATDGSETALKAAAYAGELARAFDARVSVLCVQSDELIVSNAWGPGGALAVDQVRESLEQQAREKELPETVKAVGQLDQDANAVLIWGHAATEICRFASEQKIDLIVIGSHGRSGLREALLGSVSHAVANRAPCPVTIVR